jgi:hypothetical protein
VTSAAGGHPTPGGQAQTPAQTPAPRARRGGRVPVEELIALTRWHIDRYDRLRASTATRASVLLSANSVLMAGSAFLVDYHLQTAPPDRHPVWTIFFAVVAAITIGLVLRSLWSCVDAIAARKTTRMVHPGEIPSRFLFNWGDTLKAVDGSSSFVSKVSVLSYDEVLRHASAELWTDILQHSQRHRHLRAAISVFRYGIVAFLVLATVTFVGSAR